MQRHSSNACSVAIIQNSLSVQQLPSYRHSRLQQGGKNSQRCQQVDPCMSGLAKHTTVDKADFPLDKLITNFFGRLQVLGPAPYVRTAEDSNPLQLPFSTGHACRKDSSRLRLSVLANATILSPETATHVPFQTRRCWNSLNLLCRAEGLESSVPFVRSKYFAFRSNSVELFTCQHVRVIAPAFNIGRPRSGVDLHATIESQALTCTVGLGDLDLMLAILRQPQGYEGQTVLRYEAY